MTKSEEENDEFRFDRDIVQIDKYFMMFLPVDKDRVQIDNYFIMFFSTRCSGSTQV